MSLIKAMLIKV